MVVEHLGAVDVLVGHELTGNIRSYRQREGRDYVGAAALVALLRAEIFQFDLVLVFGRLEAGAAVGILDRDADADLGRGKRRSVIRVVRRRAFGLRHVTQVRVYSSYLVPALRIGAAFLHRCDRLVN